MTNDVFKDLVEQEIDIDSLKKEETYPFWMKVKDKELEIELDKMDLLEQEDPKKLTTNAVKPKRTWKKIPPASRVKYPYRANGVIVAIYRADDGSQTKTIGSGTLISPKHVITAAHNIYAIHKEGSLNIRVGFAEAVHFFPGVSLKDFRRHTPYGTHYATKIFKAPKYKGLNLQDGKNAWLHDMQHDWAMITLNKDIGRKVGYIKLHAPNNKELGSKVYHVCGYPTSHKSKYLPKELENTDYFENMYYDYNRNKRCVSKVSDEIFGHDLDIWVGMSGAAIWEKHASGLKACGIVSFHYNGKNYANRITPEKYKQFMQWMKS